MAASTDGPWEYANDSFILDADGTPGGEPAWVFRYKNTTTGQKSIRSYVRIPEFRARYTAIGLDQTPLHGSLPR